MLEGLKDSKDPNSWKLDRPEINKAVQDAQARVRAEQQKQVEAMAEANLKSVRLSWLIMQRKMG